MRSLEAKLSLGKETLFSILSRCEVLEGAGAPFAIHSVNSHSMNHASEWASQCTQKRRACRRFPRVVESETPLATLCKGTYSVLTMVLTLQALRVWLFVISVKSDGLVMRCMQRGAFQESTTTRGSVSILGRNIVLLILHSLRKFCRYRI